MAVRSKVAQLLAGPARQRLAALTAGAVAAQVIAVAVAPVLTRLYSPSQFGTYGVASAAIGIAGAVATLRYYAAIPLPQRDRDAAALALAAIGISVGVATLTGLALIAFIPVLAPEAVTFAPLVGGCVALSVFALGAYQIVGALATRHADVQTITTTRVTQSGGIAAVQVALGVLGEPLGLLVGDALGRAAGLVAAVRLWRRWLPDARRARHQVQAMAVRYKRFPIAAGPAALMNNLTTQLPTLGIVALYGVAAGGQFLLVQRVVAVPVAIVSVSVAQDFLVSVITRGSSRTVGLRAQSRRIEKRLLIVSCPLAAVAALLAPSLFPLAFGPDWSTAGVIFAISTPLYVAALVTSPLGVVYDVLERQDLFLTRESVRLALVVAGLALCVAARPSLEVCTAILTAAGVVGYVVFHHFAYRALGAAERQAI